jgi:hypothetical protein
VRAAIGGADVVFVGGPSEMDAIRAFCKDAAIVTVPPPVTPDVRGARGTGALVGSEPYALMHAPLESTQNQVQAVRAAQIADVNLVIAGPVADADYAALVRAFAGDRALIVGDPDEATMEGLYRGAEVFLDAAWVGCGLARAATALSRGAALAISNRLHAKDLDLADFLCEVDPGDVESIARGLGDVWYRRREERAEFEAVRQDFAVRAGVREVTRAVVVGYAKALERRNLLAVR